MCLCSFRSAPFSDSIVQIANGSFGAIAALHFQSSNYRFVPLAEAQLYNLSV
jgi:hypothetical protein